MILIVIFGFHVLSEFFQKGGQIQKFKKIIKLTKF